MSEYRFTGNYAIDEFNEASAYLVGAFKVLRNLAGNAIREKEALKLSLGVVRQLVVDLENSDDLDYIRRVLTAIKEVIDSPREHP